MEKSQRGHHRGSVDGLQMALDQERRTMGRSYFHLNTSRGLIKPLLGRLGEGGLMMKDQKHPMTSGYITADVFDQKLKIEFACTYD
ncbi:unnamed protein product [Pleuronectes platessa]|uniref:Uncharacterized protein n=1 Tax=Pleuronectes platessa TaxID=8262 RepID=A0A9N7TUK5_PLEPL|nr:unnamed protein product [Pleuronectes platessa]